MGKMMKGLAAEFMAMHKLTGTALLAATARTFGTACAAASILKLLDMGSAAILGLFL